MIEHFISNLIGQAYVVRGSVKLGQAVTADMLTPVGDTLPLSADDPVPPWVMQALAKIANDGLDKAK